VDRVKDKVAIVTGGGSIINVSSIMGILGGPTSVYRSSKGGQDRQNFGNLSSHAALLNQAWALLLPANA